MSLDSDFDYIMPFGKYKGQKMGDLPVEYLKWLAENINETTPKGKEVCLIADRLYQYLGDEDD